MSRPLTTEVARTAFLVVCVLVDMIMVPILVEALVGRSWLLVAPLSLVPLCYAQYRLHRMWFVSPYASPVSEGL